MLGLLLLLDTTSEKYIKESGLATNSKLKGSNKTLITVLDLNVVNCGALKAFICIIQSSNLLTSTTDIQKPVYYQCQP